MSKLVKSKKFQTFLLLALTILVLFFLLKDNFVPVVTQIFKMDLFWIVVTMLLIFGFWLFKAFGINIITNQMYPEFKVRDSIKINLTAQFFNSITPWAVGGHPVQLYLLKQKNISLSDGTNIIIQNFIVYQIAISVIQMFAVAFIFTANLFTDNYLFKTLILIGFILDFVIILLLFVLAFAKKLKVFFIKIGIYFLEKFKFVKNKEKTLAEWDEKLDNFHKGAYQLMKNKKDFIKAIACNLIGLIAFYLTPLTLLYATGNYDSINAFQSIYLISCANMVGDLIPTPGKIGGFEFAFTTLFLKYIEPTVLSAILIAWRFFSYYLTLIIGGIMMNLKKQESKQIVS